MVGTVADIAACEAATICWGRPERTRCAKLRYTDCLGVRWTVAGPCVIDSRWLARVSKLELGSWALWRAGKGGKSRRFSKRERKGCAVPRCVVKRFGF